MGSNSKAPPPANPRYRLLKGDLGFLSKSLQDRGYTVHVRRGRRIDAYDPQTKEFVCGFTWHQGTGEEPGRWSFDLALADVHSLRDLKAALIEVHRVVGLRTQARTAWAEFLATKSDKRWANYLGIVAAIFRPVPTVPESPDNAE